MNEKAKMYYHSVNGTFSLKKVDDGSVPVYSNPGEFYTETWKGQTSDADRRKAYISYAYNDPKLRTYYAFSSFCKNNNFDPTFLVSFSVPKKEYNRLRRQLMIDDVKCRWCGHARACYATHRGQRWGYCCTHEDVPMESVRYNILGFIAFGYANPRTTKTPKWCPICKGKNEDV